MGANNSAEAGGHFEGRPDSKKEEELEMLIDLLNREYEEGPVAGALPCPGGVY